MAAAYIVEALRTPRGRGRPGGGLHTLSPIDLGATVLGALVERTGIDPSRVEDVIFGCAEAVQDQGANVARSAWLHAGLPDVVPGCVVSRFCGSGLEAVNLAAAKVMAGQADLVIAGGVEMMSLVGMLGTGGPTGSDAMFNTASWLTPQGISADLIATRNGYGRDRVDAYAAESQRRAAVAVDDGRIARSLVPVHDINGAPVLDRDEHPRPGTTAQGLGKLQPAFARMGQDGGFDALVRHRFPGTGEIDHVHHAGNSSGIVDGACALLIASEAAVRRHGLSPRARITGFDQVGVDPCLMLVGPAAAAERALGRQGLAFGDVDLWEINEAFAAVVLDFMDRTAVAPDRINVNGGAIAFGHPIGATGGMLVGTLVDELERRGAERGAVSMCVGLGMAVATVLERVTP